MRNLESELFLRGIGIEVGYGKEVENSGRNKCGLDINLIAWLMPMRISQSLPSLYSRFL